MIYSLPTSIRIVLTGGPGGGKTRFIEDVRRDPAWAGRLALLPEATGLMRGLGIFPGEKLFQKAMVYLQIALEDGLQQALSSESRRVILCDRGSLDPLAYWLANGWDEAEFFHYTETTLEKHYRRYEAVIHLVTTADGAVEAYQAWPAAHRPETPEQAIRMDRLLHKVWSRHPSYHRVANPGTDWQAKAEKAREILKLACSAVS